MMNKISPVKRDQIDICNYCRDYIKDLNLKSRFNSTIKYICDLTDKYYRKANLCKLFELQSNNVNIGSLTKDEMIGMYTKRFSKRHSGIRMYYDEILSISEKCPYCEIGMVSTIDHYMPKSEYPEYSITIPNLIPSCKECNINKGNEIIDKKEKMFIHPYFEEIDNASWLIVKVESGNPIKIDYYIDKNIDKILYDRLNNQFDTLKLKNLYCFNALNELNERDNLLKDYFITQGGAALSNHLNETSKSITFKKNLWKHVLYRDLSLNDWFYNHYFTRSLQP